MGVEHENTEGWLLIFIVVDERNDILVLGDLRKLTFCIWLGIRWASVIVNDWLKYYLTRHYE